MVGVSLQSTFNELLMLSDTQFIENVPTPSFLRHFPHRFPHQNLTVIPHQRIYDEDVMREEEAEAPKEAPKVQGLSPSISC